MIDMIITWGCLLLSFVIGDRIRWNLVDRNGATRIGMMSILYSIFSASTVLIWETVPVLFPHAGDDADFAFPLGFFAMGLLLLLWGWCQEKKVRKR